MGEMVAELLGQNIRLKTHQVGNHNLTCPRCSHTRKDKTAKCLSVKIEEGGVAVWNCHHCFWKGAAGNVTSHREPTTLRKTYSKPAPVEDPLLPETLVRYLSDRGITKEVAKRNRLHWDEKRKAMCFPYYQNGELVNIKYRTLDKKFGLVKDARLILYGVDDVKGADEIIIVEGEFDKLALEVCGLKNVVSVPNGAPARIKEGEPTNTGQFEYLLHAEELFEKAKKVIIATDDDPAGHNLKFELGRRIGLDKCYVVQFPTKDANECLLQCGVDVVLECIREAKPYPIKGLYEIDDFAESLDGFFNNSMRAGSPTGWETLDKLYSVMDGELTVITGIPNSGKSEFLSALLMNLAKTENKRFALFSPEDSKEQLAVKLIEKIIELPTSPKSSRRMSLSQFHDGADWVKKFFYFIVNDDGDDLPTVEWILEKARAAVYRYGIKGLVIDPYNELEHKRNANFNETEYVSMLLSKLKRFAKIHAIHIWLIAHPAKLQSDKDGKTRIPTLYDIAGSANFVNKMDNGIIVYRPPDAANQTEIHVRKIRQKHVGNVGMCVLKYEKETGKYYIPPEENRVYGIFGEHDLVTYNATN